MAAHYCYAAPSDEKGRCLLEWYIDWAQRQDRCALRAAFLAHEHWLNVQQKVVIARQRGLIGLLLLGYYHLRYGAECRADWWANKPPEQGHGLVVYYQARQELKEGYADRAVQLLIEQIDQAIRSPYDLRPGAEGEPKRDYRPLENAIFAAEILGLITPKEAAPRMRHLVGMSRDIGQTMDPSFLLRNGHLLR